MGKIVLKIQHAYKFLQFMKSPKWNHYLLHFRETGRNEKSANDSQG